MRPVKSEELKQLQLRILKEIDSFCSKNNIEYFLMYGSLIGAIRHNGIIPWDDDIDICMKRSEYERFVATFPIDHSSLFYLREQSVENSFPFYYAKICINGTHAFEPIDNNSFDVGINIDLFPLDPVPDNYFKKLIQKLYIKMNRIKLIPHTIDYTKSRGVLKNCILSILKVLFRKPACFYINNMRKFLLNQNADSKKITEIMTPYGKRAIFPEKWFNSSIRHSFENMLLPVPSEYNLILTQLYGDYMSPPPPEFQSSHHASRAFIDVEYESILFDK